ncbi:hypothetical protein SKAU_G00285420 [Synaphobranchus kaupii]|uniref:Amyloid beta precursor protein binding family A member 1 n=1 Tax=Synaphobranchus kaupii TaxID=118154 RepID=A0A9Q1IP47_SYNKA|nr:hypothetical protein SKAU_G00285420 [Synaphobranchus kaupii]
MSHTQQAESGEGPGGPKAPPTQRHRQANGRVGVGEGVRSGWRPCQQHSQAVEAADDRQNHRHGNQQHYRRHESSGRGGGRPRGTRGLVQEGGAQQQPRPGVTRYRRAQQHRHKHREQGEGEPHRAEGGKCDPTVGSEEQAGPGAGPGAWLRGDTEALFGPPTEGGLWQRHSVGSRLHHYNGLSDGESDSPEKEPEVPLSPWEQDGEAVETAVRRRQRSWSLDRALGEEADWPESEQASHIELGPGKPQDEQASQGALGPGEPQDEQAKTEDGPGEQSQGMRDSLSLAIKDIKEAIQEVKTRTVRSPYTPEEPMEPIWVMRQDLSPTAECDLQPSLGSDSLDSGSPSPLGAESTNRQQLQEANCSIESSPSQEFKKTLASFPTYVDVPGPCDPEDLIDGIIFAANYLGSTQLLSDKTPSKSVRMTQAQEAVSRIRMAKSKKKCQQTPEVHTQVTTEVDLFISTQRIKVLNADSQETMMDHPLRTISYIADIGDIVVLMARRKRSRPRSQEQAETSDPIHEGRGQYNDSSQEGRGQYKDSTQEGRGQYKDSTHEGRGQYKDSTQEGRGQYKDSTQEGRGQYKDSTHEGRGQCKDSTQEGRGQYKDSTHEGRGQCKDSTHEGRGQCKDSTQEGRGQYKDSTHEGRGQCKDSTQEGRGQYDDPAQEERRQYRMICHVFESEDAQLIAQSIGQAFSVAYQEFLRANGINPEDLSQREYSDLLSTQDMYNDDLIHFSKSENCKDVNIAKQKGEVLGVVVVESGWGSILPTVIIASMMHGGPAEKSGHLNIGDQIMSINGTSLVGLPLNTCQSIIKALKSQPRLKLNIVRCPPVTTVLIRRPDLRYQLGFSVQNGIICSLMRGGIAERGGVRVGHRIIEISGQSVVATPHERIVNILSSAVGEIHMKTMPAAMYRLLTGQEQPIYI